MTAPEELDCLKVEAHTYREDGFLRCKIFVRAEGEEFTFDQEFPRDDFVPLFVRAAEDVARRIARHFAEQRKRKT
jgi:hypothetical protein